MKKISKLLSVLLLVSLVCLSGCTQRSTTPEQNEAPVTVTEEPAPARKPNEDKLAGLNRFANFKME